MRKRKILVLATTLAVATLATTPILASQVDGSKHFGKERSEDDDARHESRLFPFPYETNADEKSTEKETEARTTTTSRFNSETGKWATIYDFADVMTREEENELLETMVKATDVCDVVLVTDDGKQDLFGTTSSKLATYVSKYLPEDGSLFLIDMQNREIMLANAGENEKTITSSLSRSIADNSYRKATAGDYAGCARIAFEQVIRLLHGKGIVQPMKIVCSALLSLVAGLLLNYVLVRNSRERSRKKRAIAGIGIATTITAVAGAETLVRTVRRERSSGGDFGRGDGGFGGGFGGGNGFSSGGHRF